MSLPDRIKDNLLPLFLGALGLAFLVLGGLQLVSHLGNSSTDVTFEQTSPGPVSSEKIAVDVEGAVIKPGVYELSSDSRIVDALSAAGGMSEEADRDYVQKSINLAQKITDGIKIYIPRVGEQVLSTSTNVSSAGSSSTININTASESDLDGLPGVGPVTAGKIIAGRPYASTQSLLDQKVVTSSVFEKIKNQISAN